MSCSDKGKVLGSAINCPNGCENGACEKIRPTEKTGPIEIPEETVEESIEEGPSTKKITEEEAQIFKFLSIITAHAIKSYRDFELLRRHDQKTINLYEIGIKSNELERKDEILWYFLIGLTHKEGIGFNRAIWFDVLEYDDKIIFWSYRHFTF